MGLKNTNIEDDGKFCVRQCARIFITEKDKVRVYCPSCDRTLRYLEKEKKVNTLKRVK